jgi:Tfp pilus assembly protein PilF
MSENEISDLIVKAYSNQKDGQLSLAIQSWNELLNHPSVSQELSANAQLNLGNLHLQQGNNDLAYESMAKAIKANPNSSEAFFCLAYMEQEKENFNEAISFFESALKIKPEDVGALNNLGTVMIVSIRVLIQLKSTLRQSLWIQNILQLTIIGVMLTLK